MTRMDAVFEMNLSKTFVIVSLVSEDLDPAGIHKNLACLDLIRCRLDVLPLEWTHSGVSVLLDFRLHFPASFLGGRLQGFQSFKKQQRASQPC